MSKILAKKDLAGFIQSLQKKYQVFAPVPKGNDFVLSKIKGELKHLETSSTILPPKELFFSPNESLFEFAKDELYLCRKKAKPITIIGLNGNDLKALALLDAIMTRPKNDPYYWLKRKNSLLIGLGTNRLNLDQGTFDLFFEEHKNEYLVIVGSKLGASIAKHRLIKHSSLEPRNPLNKPDVLFLDQDKLSLAIQASFPDKIWDDLAKICFGCGICTYVCPLCYCFDIEDEIDLDGYSKNCQGCSGRRLRHWDACFLPHFFEVSDHNFKEKLRERIYNWYYHKFVRMPKEFGFVGCVTCERCIKYCPAKINYREVLEEVLAKYS